MIERLNPASLLVLSSPRSWVSLLCALCVLCDLPVSFFFALLFSYLCALCVPASVNGARPDPIGVLPSLFLLLSYSQLNKSLRFTYN